MGRYAVYVVFVWPLKHVHVKCGTTFGYDHLKITTNVKDLNFYVLMDRAFIA